MNSYQFIIAIDPGGTTGFATRSKNGNWLTAVYTDPNELYDIVYNNSSLLDAVVIENFKAETISKYGLHTVRIIGGIQALCHIAKIKLEIREPQVRYPFKTQAKLMLDGKRHMVHEMDALAHLLRYEHDNQIGLEHDIQ